MSELVLARLLVAALAVVLAVLGVYLFLPAYATTIARLPRARYLGLGLTTLCWVWIGAELTLHPIDMIPLSTTTILVLCALCIPLSCVLLRNLLCARAIGGLMMLWPMPVILAVREFVTVWRLVPVVIGYMSLILGMVIVFYPWVFRKICDKLATEDTVRTRVAGCFVLMAVLLVIALCVFGKVVGE